MLEPTFVEVKVDMLRSMCSPCLHSLTSHRDFLSLATWKGQSIAHILASQNRKFAELALKDEEQNRKIAELALKNEEQNRKNEEQNRKMAKLQQQVQFLVVTELRRTNAIKTAKRQISYHIDDFVVEKGLLEDGQSLMDEVEATEHHGDSEAMHSPVLRCDEVDLEDVLALMD
eukprot:gene18753-13512_t